MPLATPFHSCTYFHQLSDDICQGVLCHAHPYPPSLLIGVWIIERADLVLTADFQQGDRLSDVSQAALTCVQSAVTHHAQCVSDHIQSTLDIFDYSGLMNTQEAQIRTLWENIVADVSSELWLHDLAKQLCVDEDFSQKIQDLVVCRFLGFNDTECYDVITEHARNRNSPISSAKGLVELGLLSIPEHSPAQERGYYDRSRSSFE